ncbi:MAG: hypothetical protein ABIG99_00060 [Patescibacteria group bacterium]
MVTPELLEYIRKEIGKGKTREEIYGTLISSGGWEEADLSEAFRVVIPMQNNVILPKSIMEKQLEEKKPIETMPSSPLSPISSSSSPASYSPSLSIFKSTPSSKTVSTSRSSLWQNLIFIILGLFCIISWYFYQPQIINFWNLSINNFKKIRLPSFDFSFLNKSENIVSGVPVENNETIPFSVVLPNTQIKDCGTGVAPKLNNPASYKNDPVLFCLGVSALNCENAIGVLKDDFFPSILEITKLSDSCNFKLSYGADNVLMDTAGKKLALQYISCPINIVKAIDNTNPEAAKFLAPDKTDLSKYASQIYFYGTLGLFVENNLDQNKIQNLGCQGEYIQSVIASYNLSLKK